ncbi:hypothetical protein OPU71_16765 [Niveibacterium sp. 24ML]|uniref:hypothetical protein n=1 Tax=Niveibacterium sp. 24ML TaxID=2985512 RepID=UPI0022710691|nr:hypothetical protein [Niveibacterium sp. 24ML]MCX9157778.1 hypothetical protein [Niveibacterium sp. 24ML]
MNSGVSARLLNGDDQYNHVLGFVLPNDYDVCGALGSLHKALMPPFRLLRAQFTTELKLLLRALEKLQADVREHYLEELAELVAKRVLDEPDEGELETFLRKRPGFWRVTVRHWNECLYRVGAKVATRLAEQVSAAPPAAAERLAAIHASIADLHLDDLFSPEVLTALEEAGEAVEVLDVLALRQQLRTICENPDTKDRDLDF